MNRIQFVTLLMAISVFGLHAGAAQRKVRTQAVSPAAGSFDLSQLQTLLGGFGAGSTANIPGAGNIPAAGSFDPKAILTEVQKCISKLSIEEFAAEVKECTGQISGGASPNPAAVADMEQCLADLEAQVNTRVTEAEACANQILKVIGAP